MVPFVDSRFGDIAIYQSGESMSPTVPPGAVLHLRRVEGWRDYFGYGNVFVLVLVDGRRVTKEVTRCDADPANYVTLVSHNPDVPDEDLPKSMISQVWKVLKILINNGW
jgi:hypothetical protein